jgi:uncharacterized membrane protein YdjX (TVP38/TMEM64 family)
MTADHHHPAVVHEASGNAIMWLRRLAPLGAIALAMVAVYLMGWHHQVSLKTLVGHRAVVEHFVADHYVAALAVFAALYVAGVALSVPGAWCASVTAGFLFGWPIGGATAIVSATIGATIVYQIARTACGESLLQRAGPRATKIAAGFRAHAFSYLLSLRLIPVFPFWLVNLAPALVGVRRVTFVAATAIGIIPATLAFAMVGAGLDSVIAAQGSAYQACLATGRDDCRFDFDPLVALTPQLVTALVVLGIAVLIPIVVRRWRAGATTRT